MLEPALSDEDIEDDESSRAPPTPRYRHRKLLLICLPLASISLVLISGKFCGAQPSAALAVPQAAFNARAVSSPAAFEQYEAYVLHCNWTAARPFSKSMPSHWRRERERTSDNQPSSSSSGFPEHELNFPDLVTVQMGHGNVRADGGGSAGIVRPDPPVQTCTLPTSSPTGGAYYITRVGPITLQPGEWLITNALPLQPSSGGYLIEAVDLARDPRNGRVHPSPPIHMHHSQGFPVTHMQPNREMQPQFTPFTPLANLWSRPPHMDMSDKGIWIDPPSRAASHPSPAATSVHEATTDRYSPLPGDDERTMHVTPSSFPVAINDLVCADLDPANGITNGMECSYLRLPAPYGLRALPQSELWANSMLINEVNTSVTLILEHGRRFVPLSEPRTPFAPLYLQLCRRCEIEADQVRAEVRSLIVAVGAAPSGSGHRLGDKIVWSEAVMPVDGFFFATFAHIHSPVLPCEVVVLAGPAHTLLAENLTTIARGRSGESGGLLPLGNSGAASRLHAALRSHPAYLCSFRSRTVSINGANYSRGSTRTDADDTDNEQSEPRGQKRRRGCDRWSFKAGDTLTNIALFQGNAMEQTLSWPGGADHVQAALADLTILAYAVFPGWNG